jgi:hypothetical protein
MASYRFLLCTMLISACCIRCGDDSSDSFELPPDQFSINNVYDVGNNSNASDIQVDVKAATTIDVTSIQELRLIIVKASKTITLDQIADIQTGNFFSMPVTAGNQIINPTGINDSDGDPIANDTPYNIVIGVLGIKNSKQLSNSKQLTLQNKPIYAGDYIGTWEDLGPPGPGKFTISMKIDNDYAAKLFYSSNYTPYGKGTQDVTAILVVTGTSFTFSANQFIDNYTGGGNFTTGTGGGCPTSKNLTGKIVDKITLDFDVASWDDCDGTRDVKIKFTRQ